MSVFLYRYNWSHTLLHVKYNKWNSIAKGMRTYRDKQCLRTKNINSQQVPKKANIKIFVRAGNPTRDYCFTCLVTWGTDSRTAERADGRRMANQYAALLPNKVVA